MTIRSGDHDGASSRERDSRGGILYSKEFLESYGCRNCIWKSEGMCPEGFTKPEERLEKGYCDKLLDFLHTLYEEGDSLSEVKEKFHLYIQELEVLSDKRKFSELQQKYERALAEGYSRNELRQLEADINSYKTWWFRLSESVVKGLSRVGSRRSKSNDSIDVHHTISLQQIHKLARESKDRIDYD